VDSVVKLIAKCRFRKHENKGTILFRLGWRCQPGKGLVELSVSASVLFPLPFGHDAIDVVVRHPSLSEAIVSTRSDSVAWNAMQREFGGCEPYPEGRLESLAGVWGMSDDLTKETVRDAYRLLLGREPENERVLSEALNYGSISAMRRAFFVSAEFRAQLELQSAPRVLPLDSPPLDIEWRNERDAAALLAYVGNTWTNLGATRPHWSVLSDDRFAPDTIGRHRHEFFQSGARDRDLLLATLNRLGRAPASYTTLFEFGCGVGRVTPFLARSLPRLIACDVSTTHVAIAREILKQEKIHNVTLRLASARDFGMTEGFDIWFSRLVLQHNPPPLTAMVLRRAMSLLSPGGLAHFQLPTYARAYRFKTKEYLEKPSLGIEMHVFPMPAVFEIAAETGCEPLEVWHDNSLGDLPGWVSSAITVWKPGYYRAEN
jgi:SAM-dependent methyltransferase